MNVCLCVVQKVREPLVTAAHVVTVSGLQPSTSYNCTVTSSSYSSASDPAFITVSTSGEHAVIIVFNYLQVFSGTGQFERVCVCLQSAR